ncbi:DUF1853 family protein [Marinobacter sp. CA1]|uniref:DUF1853 family protein n=1 Tax=Marinobacter sp. CA1 TaxID=2817656 RepID=UPI001D06CE71|nr:DUF1853 family protein [Marinobacter sp. CA1]UDL03943.1 DUF1853 family protein [Marinobacter sp. CA1]
MNENALPDHQALDLLQQPWQTPAVRHLAWLCQAAPLVDTGPVACPRDWLPTDTSSRLQRLDAAPAPLLAALGQCQSRRLGHYFETLYRFFLEQFLGWRVLLSNTAIRAHDGRTLGELDLVVENPLSNRLEHHEIAVKFYLGHPQGGVNQWLGPNAQDRLDLKTERMVTHQCTLAQRPLTREWLAGQGIQGPLAPVLVMPGMLFTPLTGQPQPTLPDWVNPGHDRGQWLYHHQLPGLETDHWVHLDKPDWLGRYQQPQPPEPESTRAALASVAAQSRPRPFALMIAKGDGFIETRRFFVVPDHWPGPPDDAGRSDHPAPHETPPAG